MDSSVQEKYSKIRSHCAITTAASEDFAPFLVGLLNSLRLNFPDHPHVYIFDLGLSAPQRLVFGNIRNATLLVPPQPVPFWRFGYTWKPLIWEVPKERYLLHIDSGVFVLRSLAQLFCDIHTEGYIAFSQNQKLAEITSLDVAQAAGIDLTKVADQDVLAAGVFGFSRDHSAIREAIAQTAALARAGWGLGYSQKERHRIRDASENVIRDCPLFRHDQTLINLALRKHLPVVKVRPNAEYLGAGTADSHPTQYMFHHRRKAATWDSPYLVANPSSSMVGWVWMRAKFALKYGRLRRKFAKWRRQIALKA